MIKKEIRLEYVEFSSISELPANIQEMIHMALEGAKKAYSPYSEFQVGAAVELSDGQRLCANNQENKAYPSGICAERSLLFFANGNYPETAVKIMVLVACSDGKLIDMPVYPCGACRQVMMETEERYGEEMEIWMVGAKTTHMIQSMNVLLPLKFSFSH